LPSRATEPAPAATLRFERRGEVGVLTLNRAAKRNALDDPTVEALGAFFAAPPEGVRAVVGGGRPCPPAPATTSVPDWI
jgi:enoyl-CoA hydratase/carnithine racemase